MKTIDFITPIRVALRHLTLAVPLGAALLSLTPPAQAVPPVTNGLVVWLSADSINTGDTDQVRIVGADTFVKLWKDGSGGAHNASQTIDAAQPKYIASGVGGKPVLRFAQTSEDAGSEMKLGDLSAFFPAAGSMFAVSTIDSDGRYNLFDNRDNDSRWVANSWNESQPGVFRNARTVMPYASWPQTGSHIFAMESSSSLYRFVIDGTALGGATGGSYHNGSGQNWTIGDRPSNNQQLKGDIPEIILYNRVLTSNEANLVGAYLTAKYGLTSTYPALPPPNVPTGVTAMPSSSGAIAVTWAAAEGATSYNVSITDTVTTVTQVVNNVTSPYVASGLINGRPYDFTVSSTNSTATSAYSSIVTATPGLGTACDILSFVFPNQLDTVISGTNISLTVPTGTNVTAFAPTYTASSNSTGSPASGTPGNFTSAQTYTITAEDGVTVKTYTVTVTEGVAPNVFTWVSGVSGNWSDSTKWTNNLNTVTKPISVGQVDYTLNFNQAITATNNLSAGYLVNKLNFGNTVILAGNGLALSANGATLPTINQNSGNAITINAPLSLDSNTTFGGTNTGPVVVGGNITGTGSLTKSNGGSLDLNGANTYTGGTMISVGQINCSLLNPSPLGGAGSINVTVQSGATLAMNRNKITGNLTLNGGKVATANGWADDEWNGPVALSGISTIDVGGTGGSLALNGIVSGTGNLIKLGTSDRAMPLNAANTYSGNLTISQGAIALGAVGSIDNVALISIAAGATFDVSAKSAYSFTSSNSLVASGTGVTLTTQAKIKGAAAGTVNLGSRPVTLTYNALSPALTVTQGTLVLGGNPFTVNTASPLGLGNYTIVTQTVGSITSSGVYPGVTGTAIGVGKVGTISVIGSNVVLTISVPTLELVGFPTPQVAGVAGNITVTAKDGAGNTATNYTGTVRFTSTDVTSTLPANYTFVAGDNGVHTFTSGVTLKTVGSQSITATDTTTNKFSTQSGIEVTPASAATLMVSGFPASKIAGTAGDVLITAKDAFNNVATGYTGTVAITSSDTAATLPVNYTFEAGDSGVKALSVTLNTVSEPRVAITATDTVTGTISGTQSGILVLPDTSAATLQVTDFPNPQTAGVAGSVTVTAKTSGGATATGYTGTIKFTSTDGAANLPADYTFVAADNGVHTFTDGVTLTTATAAGLTKSITATDTTTLITGSQSDITVNPAAAATLMVSGYPSPQFAGTAGTVTVTAKDAFNNTDSAYAGTVSFTSTDSGATLPSAYTFEGGDNGVHIFTGGVTFATVGTQAITATDAATGTITGTQSAITVNLVPSIFNWVNAAGGFWDNVAGWTNDAGISYAPVNGGQSNYVLNFTQAGTYTTTNNIGNGFLLNRLNFGGAAVTLNGVNFALTNNGAILPQINQNGTIGITVNNNVDLGANTTVGGTGNGSVSLNGQLTGIGSLTKTTSGSLGIYGNSSNTYSGGTIISAGVVNLVAQKTALLGTGPVSITNATLDFNGSVLANAMTLNNATLSSSNGWLGNFSGTINVTGNNTLDTGLTGNNTITGDISGSGGLTKIGFQGWPLSGINTYSGNTTVNAGSITLADNGGLRFALTNGASNKVTGPGTANLNGDFTIDTTAVTANTGTWTLVDTTTKTFGSTFTVVGFTPNADGVTWVMTNLDKTWSFVESTGMLTLTTSGGGDYSTWANGYPSADLSNPVADNDGDGLNNQQEYAFGLNPTLGSSVTPIVVSLDKTTGTFSYTRRASSLNTGITYAVETSTDLASWPVDAAATQTVMSSVDGVETVAVTVSGAPLTAQTLFVRVKAVLAP